MFNLHAVELIDLREALNADVVLIFPILAFLLIRHVVIEVKVARAACKLMPGYGESSSAERIYCAYRELHWSVKVSIGWALICIAEVVRSAIVWIVLEFERQYPTYLLHIIPFSFSLLTLVVGAVCVIRHLTPEKWGRHTIWLPTFVAAIVVSAFIILR